MLLNQTAQYALRAMAVLTTRWPEGRVTSAEIAAEGNIPAHYVSKVLRRLVLAELVDAQRGHNGGFQLAREPEAVSLAEVLEAVDVAAESDRCAFGLGRCNPREPCALHGAYSMLSTCVAEWARTTTLGATASIAAEARGRAAPDGGGEGAA